MLLLNDAFGLWNYIASLVDEGISVNWWNDSETSKSKYSDENLSHRQFLKHKSHAEFY